MGANKTDKAIERMTRAAGGLREIDLNFDNKTGIKVKPSSHSHKSSKDDEQQIITDLMNLKPFSSIEGRKHDAFPDASSNTLAALDKDAFHEWLKRHQKNFLMHAPVEDDVNNDDHFVLHDIFSCNTVHYKPVVLSSCCVVLCRVS
jgi:hypothetical protein